MPVISIVLTLAVIGFVTWLILKYIPMVPIIQLAIKVIVAVLVVIWLLKVTGLWGYLSAIKV